MILFIMAFRFKGLFATVSINYIQHSAHNNTHDAKCFEVSLGIYLFVNKERGVEAPKISFGPCDVKTILG